MQFTISRNCDSAHLSPLVVSTEAALTSMQPN